MSLSLASTILNGIGTGFGILSGAHNAYSQAQANKNNLAFAREQFDYQRRLNELTMFREDNAVQRRVADLENAGFNKRLAVGASADASSLTAGSSSAGQSGANLIPLLLLVLLPVLLVKFSKFALMIRNFRLLKNKRI